MQSRGSNARLSGMAVRSPISSLMLAMFATVASLYVAGREQGAGERKGSQRKMRRIVIGIGARRKSKPTAWLADYRRKETEIGPWEIAGQIMVSQRTINKRRSNPDWNIKQPDAMRMSDELGHGGAASAAGEPSHGFQLTNPREDLRIPSSASSRRSAAFNLCDRKETIITLKSDQNGITASTC
nr:hydroxyproline O-galactosyltransferase hpgt1 [Ipomoea batatas]